MTIAGGLIPHLASAAEAERNIMASSPGGTHWVIAEDISKLGNKCGLPLNVVESAGSLENFFGVRNRPNTQFGIVAGDILNYLKSYQGSNKEVHEAVQGMRIMLPLYDTEVQVVAREGINTMEDLNGKRVGVGPEDGAANLTSSVMFDILKIKPAERVKRSNDDMIELLRQGEIDAFMRVSGAPVADLNDGRLDERFHIVPITQDVLKASYKSIVLPAGTYGFQKTPVQLVGVKTLLMTYEFGTAKNEYYKKSCKAVADFTNLIVDHIDELKETGHPKWKDVDLTEIPAGWQIGDCVRQGLDPNYEVQCEAPAASVDPANQEFLDLLRKHMHN